MISESLIKKNTVVKPEVDFSIIMVVFNTEIFIKYAIESVINQTYENWELIIVDDCSQDRSYEIALKYQSKDNRIKCFRLKKNKGQGYARNYAIKKASGDWISTLDSDDIFLNNKLEAHKEIIDSYNDNLILIGSGLSLINKKGKFLKKVYFPSCSKKLKRNLLKFHKFPPHSSIVCQRKALLDIGGYNEFFYRSQDYDLWLRLMNKGNFTCIKKILIQYRVHDSNASKKNLKNLSQYHFSVAALVCNYFRENNFDDPSNNQTDLNFLLTEIDTLYHDTSQSKILEIKRLIQSYSKSISIFILMKFFVFHPLLCYRLIIERLGYLYFLKKVFNHYKKIMILNERV